MRLLIINPNTNQAMTATIEKEARKIAAPATEVTVLSNRMGVASVEGHADELISGYGVLELVQANKSLYDGFLLACFSNHPAINACRELVEQPVLGILEAAVLVASMLGSKIGIITTSPRWVPMLEEGVQVLGLQDRLAAVKSTKLAVLDLNELSPESLKERLLAASKSVVQEQGADVICLGCAGMSGLAEELSKSLQLPVVDGVGAGVKLLELLNSLGLKTSKSCKYQFVEPREAMQLSAILSSIYTT